jgi:Arc/MetJ-type ribon-helix-helix transcriptional regulator
MKTYIHARLSDEDRAVLDELKKWTGRSESELVREGLRLIQRELKPKRSALDVAGKSSGKFRGGPKDLSTSKEHLAEFGL